MYQPFILPASCMVSIELPCRGRLQGFLVVSRCGWNNSEREHHVVQWLGSLRAWYIWSLHKTKCNFKFYPAGLWWFTPDRIWCDRAASMAEAGFHSMFCILLCPAGASDLERGALPSRAAFPLPHRHHGLRLLSEVESTRRETRCLDSCGSFIYSQSFLLQSREDCTHHISVARQQTVLLWEMCCVEINSWVATIKPAVIKYLRICCRREFGQQYAGYCRETERIFTEVNHAQTRDHPLHFFCAVCCSESRF